MELWSLSLVVAGAGAAGGMINALITDNGFPLPRKVSSDGAQILRPGFIGNMLIGAAAAFITWGLYGRYADSPFVGRIASAEAIEYYETLAAVAGAFLVGIGGARILTAEIDKKLLKIAGAQAATSSPSSDVATAIAVGPPAEALRAVQNMSR